MIGAAQAARPWMRGFDSLGAISPAQALRAKAEGFDFVGRYVEDMTIAEVQGLFAAGLAIAPLTEGITTPGEINAANGTALGRARAQMLKALGCPPDVHLWTDHEDPPPGAQSVSYLTDRAAATLAAGFLAGLYLGEPTDLTGPVAYALRGFTGYWRGGGAIPEPLPRGWQIYQAPPLNQPAPWGGLMDVNFTMTDYRGANAILWWPS